MRVASINFYVGNTQPYADTARIRNLELDVIGFQEMHNHLELVDKQLPNHRLYHARRAPNLDAAREVAVGLRQDNQLIGYHAKEVSDLEPGEETKIFKSRWITVVRFVHKSGKNYHRFAIINYHGNAVVQGPSGNVLKSAERVKEWVEAAREIERTIKALKEAGFKVVVTGDFNYRRYSIKGFTLFYWSPQLIFKRCGLKWIENRLDYVAWPKTMHKRSHKIIPQSITGSDHDWIVVDLQP